MKWIKLFKKYRTEEEEIAKICNQHGIKNWSINKDGLVDVAGDVALSDMKLTKLPLKFGTVDGGFYCHINKLTTLEGAPKSVGYDFFCGVNHLTTLEGAPKSVGNHFGCSVNKLTTLKGAPQSVSGDFWCNNNKLTTLEGAPKSVGGNFNCNNNKLTTLKGGPESVGDNFDCSNNKLTTLEGAPQSVVRFSCLDNPLPPLIQSNIKYIIDNQEIYHIYNKDGTINEYRFQLMMDSMD